MAAAHSLSGGFLVVENATILDRDMTEGALTFASQAEWESWLEQNGGTSTGAWLRFAKKGVGQRTVSYEEAVESALCHGWIDGQKKAESEQYWLQRFTPRSAKSIWSKINKDKAEALIVAGRMRPAGLREIERAKQDGRWEAAYTSASNSIVPDDLQAALDANPKAAKFFATLNSRNRYAILFRIQHARKPETRARKIAEFIDMLKRGETFHP
ncbi:putative periplasmic membrane protein [Burkholderia cenocepacia KC-01]|nr:putative periplasmic membrane protein [Burkholderia cenocepacia KC-01]